MKRRNCLFRHIIEEKVEGGIEVMGRRRKQLLDSLKEREIERGSTRSQCMEKSVWKRLWTSRKTHYGMAE